MKTDQIWLQILMKMDLYSIMVNTKLYIFNFEFCEEASVFTMMFILLFFLSKHLNENTKLVQMFRPAT